MSVVGELPDAWTWYSITAEGIEPAGIVFDGPRCSGTCELIEVLTPGLDYRDPAFNVREFECPGCPDCWGPPESHWRPPA